MFTTSRFTRCLLSLALLATVVVLPACEKQDLDGDGWAADDCDDENAAVNPDADEICDWIDNDCDDLTDAEDSSLTNGQEAYEDADEDGYGNGHVPIVVCPDHPDPDDPVAYSETSDDCNDEDPFIHPDQAELCDPPGAKKPVDENCDGVLNDADTSLDPASLPVGYVDEDGDGIGAEPPTLCVDATVAEGGDCDDDNPDVSPAVPEACNGVDDDCDDLVDDEDTGTTGMETFYADGDGDGYGDPDAEIGACPTPIGHVANDDDCDDSDSAINPAQPEICDPYDVDENCNGDGDDSDDPTEVAFTDGDVFYTDTDADGIGSEAVQRCDENVLYRAAGGDCDDFDPDVYPGALELCDGDDNDCDGVLPETESDVDLDGFAACDGDCNDMVSAIRPGAAEVCDGFDNDCDALIDLDDGGVTGLVVAYPDRDYDGYGVEPSEEVCAYDDGYVNRVGDCDDADATVSPEGTEVCNDVDDDCDGHVDDDPDPSSLPDLFADADADGFGDPGMPAIECAPGAGWVASATDCDDADPTASPIGVESCDGVDNDCDGRVDLGSGVLCAESATEVVQIGLDHDNAQLGFAVAVGNVFGGDAPDLVVSAKQMVAGGAGRYCSAVATDTTGDGLVYVVEGDDVASGQVNDLTSRALLGAPQSGFGASLAVVHTGTSLARLAVGAPFYLNTDVDQDRGRVHVFSLDRGALPASEEACALGSWTLSADSDAAALLPGNTEYDYSAYLGTNLATGLSTGELWVLDRDNSSVYRVDDTHSLAAGEAAQIHPPAESVLPSALIKIDDDVRTSSYATSLALEPDGDVIIGWSNWWSELGFRPGAVSRSAPLPFGDTVNLHTVDEMHSFGTRGGAYGISVASAQLSAASAVVVAESTTEGAPSGSVYIYEGSNSAPSWVIQESDPCVGVGSESTGLASCDLTGDGVEEIVVSGRSASCEGTPGRAYVFDGAAVEGGDVDTTEDALATVWFDEALGSYPISVACEQLVGDDTPDLVLGTPGRRSFAGGVFVIDGKTVVESAR
jgi:hypothetical protein